MGQLWRRALVPLAVAMPPGPRAPRGFVLALCVLSALLAVAALVGSMFDHALTARWAFELPTMKQSAAISVFCLGVALVRLSLEAEGRGARLAAFAPLPAVALMGATLGERLTGVDLGVDSWLVSTDLLVVQTPDPVGTTGASAMALLLIALAAMPGPQLRRWRVLAAATALVIGYVGSVGLLAGVDWAGRIGAAFTVGSWSSVACLVMLSASELSLLRWASGAPVREAAPPPSADGWLVRRGLPVAMVLPAAVMWLQHLANGRGWWGPGVGTAVAVVLLALALWVFAAHGAHRIETLESALRRSHGYMEQRVAERTAELMDSAAHLRASRAQLAGVVDTASTVIIALDERFRVVMFNREAERVFEVKAAMMIGHPLDRLLPERSRAAHTQALERFARTGDTLRRMGGEAQLHGLRANGQEFPIAASISRVGLPHGALFTVVLRDLTEALALEAERAGRQAAELASQAKSRLLSHVSHELRTPLNAVLGFAQLLRQDLDRQPLAGVRIEYLQHIESASRQLDGLIADLLDLSRAEVGAMSLKLRPVDVAAVLRDAAAMVAPQAAARRVAFVVDESPAPVIALADRMRLLQVITNLLSNAVKYTAPDGRTHASLREEPTGVVLDVVDTGEGMTEDQLAHLFEPFNRLGRERSLVPGSGIGLALSRQLVIAMGGRIEVASRPRQGSRFTVWLPRPDGLAGPADYPAE